MPLFKPKPDSVEAIPYSVFFDSVFELADAWVSTTGDLDAVAVNSCAHQLLTLGQIDAETYSEYINEIVDKIMIRKTDDNGQAVYRYTAA